MPRKLIGTMTPGQSEVAVTEHLAFTSKDPGVMAREAEAFGLRRADEVWRALATSGKPPNRETVREFFVNPDRSIPFRIVAIARRAAQERWRVLCAQYDLVTKRLQFRRRVKFGVLTASVALASTGAVLVLAHFLGVL